MRDAFERLMYRIDAEMFNKEIRAIFESLGQDGHYTDEQKDCAFELIDEFGIRAAAKILKIPHFCVTKRVFHNY